MRPLLRRLPIRAKLVAMIMLTSATVLVLAGVGYLAWDYFRLRADMASDLQAEAQLVLENSAAALSFQDPQAARRHAGDPGRRSAPAHRVPLRRAPARCFAAWHNAGERRTAARPRPPTTS